MILRKPVFSFVLPVFNESAGIGALYERLSALTEKIDGESEFIFIDDGSTDDSCEVIGRLTKGDPRIRVVSLSRNFGHQIAITAGMDEARGDAVVVMDADLQDPPEVVYQMIAKWRMGFEVVYAVRTERLDESRFKRFTACWFYRLLGAVSDVRIPFDSGDFRLVDRKVLEAYKRLPERSRFVRGLFAWLGFRQIGIPYVREGRHAGESKYSVRSMLQLAVTALVSFSKLPLRLPFYAAVLWSALAFAVALAWAFSLLPRTEALLLTVLLVVSSSQALLLGIVCTYLGKVHDEAKGRPLYVVRSRTGGAGLERATLGATRYDAQSRSQEAGS